MRKMLAQYSWAKALIYLSISGVIAVYIGGLDPGHRVLHSVMGFYLGHVSMQASRKGW